MENKQIIQNRLLKAEKDVETAQDLFRLRHYDWSLFIWHLAIEKILKALLVIKNIPILFTHDLARLAKAAHITLTDLQITQLNEITTFNIKARYDDYKLSFYNKTTKEYTEKWIKICEGLYIYFKKDL